MLGDFNENYSILQVNNPDLRKSYFDLIANTESPAYVQINQKEEYGPEAIDSLLEYKKTQSFVGAVRVILGKKIKGKKLLPIEFSAKTPFTDILQKHEVEYDQVAEITQVVILTHFRPKMAMLGIIRAVLQSCVKENVHLVYLSLDPRIQRLLVRIGIQLNIINEPVNNNREYFFGKIDQIIQSVYLSDPLIWEVLTDQGKLCCPYKNLIYMPPTHQSK